VENYINCNCITSKIYNWWDFCRDNFELCSHNYDHDAQVEWQQYQINTIKKEKFMNKILVAGKEKEKVFATNMIFLIDMMYQPVFLPWLARPDIQLQHESIIVKSHWKYYSRFKLCFEASPKQKGKI
jgi:hypothetical protein